MNLTTWGQAVKKRDNYTCTKCGNKNDVEAHHIIPYSEQPDLKYELSNGTTLCHSCHLQVHGKECRKEYSMRPYVYPAIFTPAENNGFTVIFPDIENCYTQGKDLYEALINAEDVLCLMLYDMEERGLPIPEASINTAFQLKQDEFVSLIRCDTMEYRNYYTNEAVKKTLTIPQWLNTLAERKEINFSAVLQTALKHELGIE